MAINPHKWYWIVGNKPDVVFSGPEKAYVEESDSAYQSFIELGNLATRIVSDGELADVLTKRSMPASMIRSVGFTDWGNVPASDVREVLLACGVELTSTATPALNGLYPCDKDSQLLITSESLYILTTGGVSTGTFSNGLTERAWIDCDSTPHVFNRAQFIQFAQAVARYVDTVFVYALSGMAGDLPSLDITID